MKILAIIHGSNSHFNACLKIFSYLSGQGNTIELCTSDLVGSLLKDYPYTTHIVNQMPFGSAFENIISKNFKHPYLKNLSFRVFDVFYLKRRLGLVNVLSKTQPDVILLDILYASDVVILYPYLKASGAKLLYISTKPSLDRTTNNLPINSNKVPISKKQINKQWNKYNQRKKIKRIFDALRFFLHDDYSILKEKIATEEQLMKDHPLVWNDCVGIRFDNFPQLILMPKEFEFQPVQINEYQHYAGFQFFRRIENVANCSNYQLVENVIQEQKAFGKKIIYCSFGRIYKQYSEEVRSFIHRLFKSMAKLENVHLIISIKDDLYRRLEIPRSNSITIFDFVPQLKVLENADLFISHGGINSIKEAIYMEVPLLIFPVNPFWDQFGNGARVEYHKIGLRGDLKKITPEELERKINLIIRNSSMFKDNLKRLKQADEGYTSTSFINLFYDLLKNKNHYFDRKLTPS